LLRVPGAFSALGDDVDNGPSIPALLDRLIALQGECPERFVPILGNHDLALLVDHRRRDARDASAYAH